MIVRFLSVFLLMIHFSFSMTQNSAVKRCQKSLDLYTDLEKHKNKALLLPIKDMVLKSIETLKKSKNITDLPKLLDQCLKGVEAIEWILEEEPDTDKSVSLIETGPDVKRVAQEKPTEPDKKPDKSSESLKKTEKSK